MIILNNLVFKWAIGCVVVAGSGCATPPTPAPESMPNELQQAFIESSQQVTASVRTLAEVRNAELTLNTSDEDLKQMRLNASALPAGLDKPISIEWHGEAEPLLKLINDLTKYGEIRVYGQRPKGGAVINIKSNARPAYDVIREVGTSLGGVAEIRVIAAESNTAGAIELIYKPRVLR